MDDDDRGDALNVANLENKGSSAGPQEHGETISHVPGPDGLVNAATLRRPVASADWCHDWRLFGGGTASAGNLAEVTWGRRCWSGLVVGRGCGGSRLVDSEKSSIVTLSVVCGAGWADRERTFATRTAFSRRIRGWDLSHLQENAVLAGYRSSRYAAEVRRSDATGTVRCPAAARALREAGGSLCVRGAGPCRRSLTPSGMESARPRLSQSDSRLGAIELTELDSTTILSAYDST